MQVENHPSDQRTKKVKMEREEIDTLLNQTSDIRNRLIIQLGAFSGLRSGEISEVTYRDVGEWATDETAYNIKINSKNTGEGDNRKTRYAFLPSDTRDNIYINTGVKPEQSDLDEQIIGISTARIRQIIRSLRESAREETGEDGWRWVTSHDLRRFYARHSLNEQDMPLEIVMQTGGWEDYASIKPYIEPTDTEVVEAFREAGFD